MIINRQEYLDKMIFYTDNPSSNPLSDRALKSAFGGSDETISKIQKYREEFYAILERWGRHEIDFTDEMMKKYNPRYKGTASPFKNVGHSSLQAFESRFNPHSKYFGLSRGRSFKEFIQDANNPLYLKKNPLKKKLVLLT
jgi:hypothetical protein